MWLSEYDLMFSQFHNLEPMKFVLLTSPFFIQIYFVSCVERPLILESSTILSWISTLSFTGNFFHIFLDNNSIVYPFAVIPQILSWIYFCSLLNPCFLSLIVKCIYAYTYIFLNITSLVYTYTFRADHWVMDSQWVCSSLEKMVCSVDSIPHLQ